MGSVPLSLLQPTHAPRKHALRVLDMTGLLDVAGRGTGPWHHEHVGLHGSCGPHVHANSNRARTAEPGLAPVPVEVRVDLRVNRASYAFLREALRSSVGSPLRLCCRDLRAEDLPMRNTVAHCCSFWMQAACAAALQQLWACVACPSSSHTWPLPAPGQPAAALCAWGLSAALCGR